MLQLLKRANPALIIHFLMSMLIVNKKMLLDSFIVMNKLLITTMSSFQKLKNLMAHINIRHSSSLVKKIPSDDMSPLEPVMYLAKGARIMLTINLWSSVDLCNDATGTVVDIIY